MAVMANSIRSLKTLTNEDIIGLVDLLLNCSRLRNESESLMESGDMSYRKIEAKQADYHKGIIIRVTHSEFLEGEIEVCAFILEDAVHDVYIIPVNRTKFVKEYVEKIGTTYDFNIIEQPLRRVYMYFAETLQMWNLGGLEFTVNELLTDAKWNVIDQQIAD